ncbi:hypothetical protein AKAW_11192 [Aspergillus luchuensis IFO 4308]|nr:hypothetical protein AKAW_11192 [Aspergillus luchuensis IFO 4308]
MPLQCLLAARPDGTVYPGVHVSNRDVLHAVGQYTQRTWQVEILPAYRCVVVVIIPCRGYGAIRPPESGVPAETDFVWSAPAPFAGISEFAWAWISSQIYRH